MPCPAMAESAGMVPSFTAAGELPAVAANKQQVYVVRSGTLQAAPVTLGLSDGKYTTVTSGDVHEGDQVVVRFTTATSTPPASARASR